MVEWGGVGVGGGVTSELVMWINKWLLGNQTDTF